MKPTKTIFLYLSLVIAIIQFSNCKSPQYKTTVSITDSLVTQGGIDTVVEVIKKRLNSEKIKFTSVAGHASSKQLIIESNELKPEIINDYLFKKGELVFYECYTVEDLFGRFDAKKAEEIAKIIQFSQPYNDGNGVKYPSNIGYCLKEDLNELKTLFKANENDFPADMRLFFSEVKNYDAKNKRKIYEVCAVKNNVFKMDIKNGVTGANFDINQNGTIQVTMKFNIYNAKRWGDMTTKNVNRCIAIVFDERVLSAPNVNEPITGGNSAITIGRNEEAFNEASQLTHILSSGYLPYTLHIKNMQIINK